MQDPLKRSPAHQKWCRWACALGLMLCIAAAFAADQLWLIPTVLTAAATLAAAYVVVMLAMGAPMFVLVSAAAGLTALFRCINRWIKDGISSVRRV